MVEGVESGNSKADLNEQASIESRKNKPRRKKQKEAEHPAVENSQPTSSIQQPDATGDRKLATGDLTNAPQEKQESQEAQKSNLTLAYIAIPIAVVIAAAAFAYFAQGQSNPNIIEISGYTFFPVEGGTFVAYVICDEISIPFEFRLDPRDANTIDIDRNAVRKATIADKIYVTSNPNAEFFSDLALAASDLSRTLSHRCGGEKIVKGAYSEQPEINDGLPVKTCSEATKQSAIILLEISDKTEVIINESGCIVIKGETGKDLLLAEDLFRMHLLGINI